MEKRDRATQPFEFYTRLILSELTGLRAANLAELYDLIRVVPDSCIYNHTHRFVQEFGPAAIMPHNDFAYWVTEFLGDVDLGEELNSINIVEFSSISAIREAILTTISPHLGAGSSGRIRFAEQGSEFHFIKTVSFILPTEYVANDLREFVDALAKVSEDTIYFHLFESRLRLGAKANDFSRWLEESLGNKELADKVARLDTYSYRHGELRRVLMKVLKKGLRR